MGGGVRYLSVKSPYKRDHDLVREVEGRMGKKELLGL